MGKLKIDRTGEKFITYQGYEVMIIKSDGSNNCTVQFKGGCTLYNVAYGNLKLGVLKNPYHPSVHGIGYLGIGKYNAIEKRKSTLSGETWRGMIRRCYSKTQLIKNPTYGECTITEEWKCFQDFAKWFYENRKPYMENWQLDKDILQKGNKIYSPETCCFVPAEINSLFLKSNKARGKYPIGVVKTGNRFQASMRKLMEDIPLGTFDTPEEAFQAYKTAKELWIKEIADKWRGKIEPSVYTAMYNYQVEITD